MKGRLTEFLAGNDEGSAGVRALAGGLAYGVPSLVRPPRRQPRRAHADSRRRAQAVMFLNKKLFAAPFAFAHPRLLALLQFAFTAAVLLALSRSGALPLRPLSLPLLRSCAPLAALFLANSLLGIWALAGENVPMFSALRHLTTVLVLLLEALLLDRWPSTRALFATGLTVTGTLIAAAHDLTFDPWAYALVGVYNCASAAYLVAIRYTAERQRVSATGAPPTPLEMLLANTVLCLPVLLLLCVTSEDVRAAVTAPVWSEVAFLVTLVLSLLAASCTELGLYVNTSINSPMAQNAVGILKNTLASGIGMTLSDYVFAPLNLAGLLVNASGAFWYSYLKVTKQELDDISAERVHGKSATAAGTHTDNETDA